MVRDSFRTMVRLAILLAALLTDAKMQVVNRTEWKTNFLDSHQTLSVKTSDEESFPMKITDVVESVDYLRSVTSHSNLTGVALLGSLPRDAEVIVNEVLI